MATTPYKPIRWEDNVPVYSCQDIDDYGPPDVYGVWNYLAVSTREFECPLTTEWNDEVQFFAETKKIHHYCRIQRFRSILLRLLGQRGYIPSEVLQDVQNFDEHPSRVWRSVRQLLKKHGHSKYYNCIPGILAMLKYPFKLEFKWNDIYKVQKEFLKISNKFNELSLDDRKYFPNMRYIALRLLARQNAVFEYDIPLVTTKSKLKLLDNLFNLLIKDST